MKAKQQPTHPLLIAATNRVFSTYFGTLLLLGCTIFLTGPVSAQDVYMYQGEFRNRDMAAIAEPTSNWGWVDFREDVQLNPSTLFEDHKAAFLLGPDDKMVLVRIQEDDQLGYTHYRYQQQYKGLRVQNGEYIVHVNTAGRVYSANGKLASGLDLNVQPAVSENMALSVAMAHADGDGFLWLDEDAENHLRQDSRDPQATYYPKGELMIQRLEFGFDFLPSNYRLAWAFDLYMGFSGESRTVFVDAQTGQFLNYLPISRVCDAGTGSTAWDGTQSISTNEFSLLGTDYRLEDDCTGDHPYTLRTWDLQRGSSSGGAIDYTDLDNNWISSDDITGVSCHYAMHRTRDYLENVHAHNSYDDANSNMTAYNEAFIFSTHNNACWDCFNNIAAFGGGTSSTSATDDWNPLDIVGHEFTHGVVEFTADLVYSNQSGALNESFADIFGDMVESYSRGINDWLVGADRGAIRSFSNPNAYSDPDTYLGTNWFTGTGDNGGVHTNSGVQNHWFYLLSQGGSGTNDIGDAYSVSGIGRFDARQITYRNLAVYLTSGDQYIDSREGSIRAANDLYGSCSNQSVQTGAAWYAVGVGTGFHSNTVCGSISSIFGSLTYTGIEQLNAAGSCTTTVTPLLGTITFRSREIVRLRNGFTAVGTTVPFVARIDNCSYTVYRPPVPEDGLKGHPDHFGETGESSLSQTERTFMSLAPNPATTAVQILFPITEQPVRLRVTDLAGRVLVDRSNLDQSGAEIDVNSWPSGIYLVEVESAFGVEQRRLMVE